MQICGDRQMGACCGPWALGPSISAKAQLKSFAQRKGILTSVSSVIAQLQNSQGRTRLSTAFLALGRWTSGCLWLIQDFAKPFFSTATLPFYWQGRSFRQIWKIHPHSCCLLEEAAGEPCFIYLKKSVLLHWLMDLDCFLPAKKLTCWVCQRQLVTGCLVHPARPCFQLFRAWEKLIVSNSFFHTRKWWLWEQFTFLWLWHF